MPQQPIIVRAKDAPSFWLLRDHLTPLLSPQHTDGRFAVALHRCHPGDGPPPHIHRREDEAFYVLEGEMTFLYGDNLYTAGAGSFIWGARDIVHTFKNTGTTPAKMLLFVTPTQFLDFGMLLAERGSDFNAPPVMNQAKLNQLLEAAPKFGLEMKLGHIMPTKTLPLPAPKKRLWLMGLDITYLATSEDTGGQFSIVDIRSQPGGGPPPHAHTEMDEAFYMIEGTHDFIFDDRTETVGPGDLVYVPRGNRHLFVNSGSTPGRILDIHTSGGFEKFFDEIGFPYAEGVTPPPPPALTEAQLIDLLGRHGMTM